MNGHGTAPEAQTVYTGDKLAKVTEPTAAGYTFGGWYTDKELTKAFDVENDTVSGDTTLYAKWEAIPDHELTVKVGTFTYDDNAASDKGNVYEGALVTVTFDENNQLWKDSGLSFDHWDIQSKAKLLDENGEEASFVHVLTFVYEGQKYVALEPAEQQDDEEAEVVLLKVDTKDGQDYYNTIDNEILLNEVFNEFLDIVEEMEGEDEEE